MSDLGRIIMLNDFSVARGGATGIALLATRLLRERGYEVVFITGDSGQNQTLHDIGVQVVSLGEVPLLQRGRLAALTGGLWNSSARDFLSRWIQENGRPNDVWHLHGWSRIWSPSVFPALASVKERLVVHAHDYFNACPNGAFWDYAQAEVCERIPLSTACLTTNCDKRNAMQKLWRCGRSALLGKTFTAETAPLLLLIHPGMSRPFLRSGLRAEKMKVLRNPVTPFDSVRIEAENNRGFLFVGRLDEEKGALPLAQAAERAGVPVTFVGEGPQADAIAKACPSARLTGWQDHAAIREHARGARALVMPSVYPEPFGLVAVEALGAGLPVIASHTALLAPEIEAAQAGWAVDIRDIGEFSHTLQLIDTCIQKEIKDKSIAALKVAPTLGTSLQDWCNGLVSAYQTRISS